MKKTIVLVLVILLACLLIAAAGYDEIPPPPDAYSEIPTATIDYDLIPTSTPEWAYPDPPLPTQTDTPYEGGYAAYPEPQAEQVQQPEREQGKIDQPLRVFQVIIRAVIEIAHDWCSGAGLCKK